MSRVWPEAEGRGEGRPPDLESLAAAAWNRGRENRRRGARLLLPQPARVSGLVRGAVGASLGWT